MPAKFHPVTPAIWDRHMRSLSADAKLVRLYLLTCSNRLSEGLFHLPVGIIAHDTGLPAESVELSLDELEAAGLAIYDAEAEVVLDATALRYMPLRNGKDANGNPKPDSRIPGAVRMIQGVTDTPLKAELFRLADELAPDFAAAIAERYPELGVPSARTLEAPSTPPRRGVEGTSQRPEALRREERSREGEERSRERDEQQEASRLQALRKVMASPCSFCDDLAYLDILTGLPELRDGRPSCLKCVGSPV